MTTARWNDTVIAESDDTVIVENNHYFPLDSVVPGLLVASDTTSHCPWKGDATYFSLDLDGDVHPDVGWTYPTPLPEATHIADRVAFWGEIVVTDS